MPGRRTQSEGQAVPSDSTPPTSLLLAASLISWSGPASVMSFVLSWSREPSRDRLAVSSNLLRSTLSVVLYTQTNLVRPPEMPNAAFIAEFLRIQRRTADMAKAARKPHRRRGESRLRYTRGKQSTSLTYCCPLSAGLWPTCPLKYRVGPRSSPAYRTRLAKPQIDRLAQCVWWFSDDNLQGTLEWIPEVYLPVQRCGCYFFPIRPESNSEQIVPMLQHFEATWGAKHAVSHRATWLTTSAT